MNSSTYNINSVSLKDMYNNTIISKSITPSFISNSNSLLINSVYILDNNYKTIYIAGNNFSNVNVNSGVKFNNVVISPTVGTVSFVNNLLLRVDMVSSNYNISLVSVTDIYNRSILISEIIKVLLPSLKSTADSLAITSVNITNNLYKYIYINGQNFSDVTSVKFNDGNILPASFVVMSSILIKATMSSSTYNVYNTSVKDSFRWLSGGGLTAISSICDTLKAGQKLEDILINRIKGYVEKKRLAEEKAEGLFKEFLEKNKTRVFAREGGYIVKGKLKNYIVKMKNDEDCGVWTYPANDYICIEEKTKAGKYLCKYDKLLQFCLTMMNDNNMREQIYTIR
jgi:hypothetical protein